MAAIMKSKTSSINGKQNYYPRKPPSTPSPKSQRKVDSGKVDRGPLTTSSRRTRSHEIDRSSNQRLAECKKFQRLDESLDKDVLKAKSKVLEEIKSSEIEGAMWRRRGFSYPGEHGEIRTHNLDIMKKETTLVVLEYLSSLPVDKIRARNRDVAKAKTIHVTTDRPILKQRRKSSLYRSTSDAGENFEEARRKFKQMAMPLKRQLSENVLEEVKTFDKTALKKTLKLNLAKQKPPSPTCIQSPESIVVSKLEELSRTIMHDFPQILDEPISNILTPLDDGNTLTYEKFSIVAKVVFEKNISRFSGTPWSRIALVLYLAREIVYFGNLSDNQMELLVEYSAQFVTEHSHSFIKKQGGWGALELEDDFLVANGSLFDSSDFEQTAKLMRQDEFQYDSTDGCSDRRRQSTVSSFVNKWMSYGVAVAAVGLGVAYGFMRN